MEANLLRNGSFEFDAPAWTFQSGSGSLSTGSAGARTGQKGFVGSASSDTTLTASVQTDSLSANRSYTLSGYVKTNRMFSTDPSDYSNLKVVVAKIKLDSPGSFRNLIGSQVSVRILVKKQ